MSLAKLKKAELQALFEKHGYSYDPDWNKEELITELNDAGITAESVDNEVSTDTKHSHADGKYLTKANRQKRLFSRTNHEPGEATKMRGKKYRQEKLKERTDRTK